MRDSQRQRLYDAENVVHRQMEFAARGARTVKIAASTLTLPLEVRFGSMKAVETYLAQVMDTDEFKSRWPGCPPVKVRQRKSDRVAHYDRSAATIALHEPQRGTGWALRELVVLHELAHHVTPWTAAAHGPEFAANLIALVTETVGPEVGLLLRIACHDHNVTVKDTA